MYAAFALLGGLSTSTSTVQHVIAISFDGQRSDAITLLGPAEAPHFHRLMAQGAGTLNARTAPSRTVTIPNHTCMLTGRPVVGERGHGNTSNRFLGLSLHELKGSYIASVFDVVHDHGLKTGMAASKPKFRLFDVSWDARHGAKDRTGPDHGRDKLDISWIHKLDDQRTQVRAIEALALQRPAFLFVHFAGADIAGHLYSWRAELGSAYMEATKKNDARLGALLDAIERDPQLKGKTAVIVTADHGGYGPSHGNPNRAENYTIPFLVWGPGVQPGGDLYSLSAGHRADPGRAHKNPTGIEPVRNCDMANLSLQLLGLGPVPGSVYGRGADHALRLSQGAPLHPKKSTSPVKKVDAREKPARLEQR